MFTWKNEYPIPPKKLKIELNEEGSAFSEDNIKGKDPNVITCIAYDSENSCVWLGDENGNISKWDYKNTIQTLVAICAS